MGNRYKILVHGNNATKSSQLFEKLQLSYPDNNSTEMGHTRLEFYAYPDLDLYNRFQEPQIDDTISKLISDTSDHGGVSLFIILISQTEVFSPTMREMIINLPKNGQFPSEEYFWDHATILFSFEDKIENNYMAVLKSMKRNVGIKEVVEKAGDRYICMSNSTSKDDILHSIILKCKEIEQPKRSCCCVS